jgi:hypothetical protein
MPKPETIERALQEIKKGYAQYNYFFDKLSSPAWIQPLAEKGFFKHPPAPITEENSVSYPFWPESRYLSRMATIASAQEMVVNTVLAIPSTPNVRVHLDVVEIALSVAPPLSARLLPKSKEWFSVSRHLLLPQKVGALISRLANGAQTDAALELAKRALKLSPDAKQAEKQRDDLFFPEPETLFRDWDYEGIIAQALPSLSNAGGLRTVGFFCGLLDQAINLSRREPDEGDEDYIYISHEVIADGPQHHQPASVLICAVRDSAETLIRGENDTFPSVIELLRKYKWPTFRRLELHLCRIFPNLGLLTAEKWFAEPQFLDEPSLQREGVLLLKGIFEDLSEGTRQRILQWIDTGPSEEFQKWLLTQDHSEAEVEGYVARWRRDRFAVVEGFLPRPYAAKYEELVQLAGPAEHLEARHRQSFGAYAPPSPKNSEDLRGMNIDQVLDFLRSWEPTKGLFDANEEGLSRELNPLIAADAQRYASRGLEFRSVDPTYVRAFFEGLNAALKSGTVFEWEPPLALSVWVLEQPREIPGRKGDYFVKDPDWGWTRNSIVELLREGFVKRPGQIPLDQRARVWSVIESLAKDSDPESEREKREKFEPAFTALNSTRGRAIDLALRYASWVRGDDDNGNKDVTKSFKDIPEVQKLLEDHLDVANDPSLAIRSLYGKNLRYLAGLDWAWLESNLHRIFPEEEDLFRAAWESYVVFCQPHLKLLETLRWAYELAVENLGKIKPWMKNPDSPDDRLGDHLIHYYWWGTLDLKDALFERFLANAPLAARTHVMWYIAHSARGWDDNVPPEVLARLERFFESRLDLAEKLEAEKKLTADVQRELASFGFWLECSKFPEDWRVKMLVRVVQLTKSIEPSMTVLQRLPAFSEKYPAECVKVIGNLAEGQNEDWLFVGVESEASLVFKNALKSSMPAIAQEARRVIEQLIARGHSGFRYLLV